MVPYSFLFHYTPKEREMINSKLKEALGLIPELQNLPNEVMGRLIAASSELQLKEDEVLFHEGEMDHRFFIVVSGQLKSFKKNSDGNDIYLRDLKKGDMIGITSFFTDGLRSATVKSMGKSELWVIDFEKVKDVIYPLANSDANALIKGILHYLSNKVRKKNRQVIELADQGADDRLKIAFFDSRKYITDAFKENNPQDWDFRFLEPKLNKETASLAQGYPIICCFVNDVIDAETVDILDQCGVRLIAMRCAGYNNVDLEACKKRDIDVVRVPAYSPYAVAEHATAMLLALNRKLHHAYNRVRQGNFTLDDLVGFDLYGKTVGVIGTGKIGECFVRQMAGFGCKVLCYDKYPNKELESIRNVEYTSLEDLFEKSHVISLHTPLLEETHHLINDDSISKMRDGVYIINTSRGGLIDTQALIRGLKNKKVGAAALDVYEEEAEYFFEDKSTDVISDDTLARLMTFNNVFITSHQAFLTKDALKNIADTTIQNIDEYTQGKRGAELTNRVD